MADALHSNDISAADFGLSPSQVGQSSSKSLNSLEKQQSSNVPDNFPGYAFENSENCVKHNVVVSGQEDDLHAFIEEAEVCCILEETERAAGKHEIEVQARCSEKCPLEILQVIDDTAILDTYLAADEKNENDDGNGNRKEKRPRRRSGKGGKNKDTLFNYCNTVGKDKRGLMYSRDQMMALRFEGVEEQTKIWVEAYCRLDPLIAQEYDGLVKSGIYSHQQEHVVDFDPRPQFLKAANLGENSSQVADNHFQNSTTSDPVSCLPISDEAGQIVPERECDDDDSDEDYGSIHKPAFVVTGEPDFDSGPPRDGLEYLRRVRWEAAQIPKVKVSKAVKVKEQRPYMPQIPDIMECPKNLLPLKEWEDSFLAEFSELRLGFSQLEFHSSTTKNAINLLPIHETDNLGQMFESIIFQNFDITTSTGNSFQHESSCSLETGNDGTHSPHSLENSSIISDYPTVSMILKMDPAARNSMLKRRIRSIENMTTLPRNDCLWLFALCAVVDSPLDADTCAALRSLLRKCASLRAAKTELDDEVVMLNIIATISGRYFGQSEKD